MKRTLTVGFALSCFIPLLGPACAGGQGTADSAPSGADNGVAGEGAGVGTGSTFGSGAAQGAGGNGSATGGRKGTGSGGTVATVDCGPMGATCDAGSDCCSGMCDGSTGACAQNLAVCAGPGTPCVSGTECCNLSCQGGVCQGQACTGDGQACDADGQCCGGACGSDGKCVDVNGTEAICKSAGNSCSKAADCCSGLCGEDGLCRLGSSFCVQLSDICTSNEQCCQGTCVMGADAKVGYCGRQVSSGSSCDNKLMAGEVCGGDCSACCSRSCAPHSGSGVTICMPPSGCRPDGELCQKDEDCCGGDPDADVPGAGNTHCEDINEEGVGRCKGMACTPQGGICKYSEASYEAFCGGGSTSPNNCCSFLGSSSNCALDSLNIPRCDGIDTCREAGEDCATSDDCCGGLPCVQGDSGSFTCYEPPSGSCVPAAGPCTTDGDCCRGSLCLRLPGQATGTCGDTSVEPPLGQGGEGNVGAGGGSSSSSGGSSSSSGGASSATGGSTSDSCGAYGQDCETAADCCNDVPCDAGICRYPIVIK